MTTAAELYGFVYFLQAETMRLVKIGSARDPSKRLGLLKTGSPDRLKLLGVIPTNERQALERRLHQRFAQHRQHGEWFTPAPDLLAFIADEASPHRVPRPRNATERIREAILRRRAEEAAA